MALHITGFKQLYASTPFDLLLSARMEMARRLLDDKGKFSAPFSLQVKRF
jgi:hypothetical protein